MEATETTGLMKLSENKTVSEADTEKNKDVQVDEEEEPVDDSYRR